MAALGLKTCGDNLTLHLQHHLHLHLQHHDLPVIQESDLSEEIRVSQGPHILFNTSGGELCNDNIPDVKR